MKFSIQEFLTSISITLDFIEMDMLSDVTFHNRRVAYICEKIGSYLRLSDEQLLNLTECALLHDVGMGTYSYKSKKNDMDNDGPKEHCIQGQAIIDMLPIKASKDIILYHHEAYDGSGFFGLTANETPLFSQIICLADKVDVRLRNSHNKHQIRQWVTENENRLFSGQLVRAFLEVSSIPAFWIDLTPLYIPDIVGTHVEYIDVGWDYIRQISGVMSSIIDMKSAFTARHSSGLADKAEIMANYYHFDEDKLNQFVIAANLHDLGKLAVPNSILDKPGKLTDEEFEVIQVHTYYTRKALEKITGFERITEWASNHHERLVGKGYPYGINDLDFESRLMCVLDIYQALTENRPYRDGMTHEKAMKIINQLVESGVLDQKIVSDTNKVLQS